MAWLNAEGKMKYKKAFGRDALSKLLEFLYKNREEFNGYYMYAHNGGAFDFTVLMNDCLLNHDKWKLNCQPRPPRFFGSHKNPWNILSEGADSLQFEKKEITRS